MVRQTATRPPVLYPKRVKLQENVPLAPYTTLGVGGPARWFVETASDDEVLEAVRFARAQHLPFFILGGGSNLLVADEGFAGVVIHPIVSSAPQIATQSGGLTIHAAAGADWDFIVRLAVEHNAAGIECLAGIPGSVGGTPVQNVGAYGQEVSHAIAQVHGLDLQTETPVVFSNADCGFSYRRSIFNTTQKGRYAITAVEYGLCLDQPPSLEYRDVKNYFTERGIAQPTLVQTADAVREIRARKGMLLDEHDPDSRSAGSFFKNPIVPRATLEHVASLAGRFIAEIPQFPAGEGHSSGMVKLSAAWLMELAGFHKGFGMGRAGLSSKHVLAIVNRGGASANEILALRNMVVAEVQARTGVHLEQEPVMLGFTSPG